MSGLGLVHNIGVVEHGIHGFNSRNGDIALGGQLNRGSEEVLHLHGSSGLEVLEHGGWRLGGGHFFDGLLPEIAGELAIQGVGQGQEFIDNSGHELTHSDLF